MKVNGSKFIGKMQTKVFLINKNTLIKNAIFKRFSFNKNLVLNNNEKYNTFIKLGKKNFWSHDKNLPTNIGSFKNFIKKIKAVFNKRVVLFRMLFYSSFLFIIFTVMRLTNSTIYAKNVTPVYFLNNEATESAFYNVAGLVKPGTIQIIKGTDEMNFSITDYEHQMSCYYKGPIPPNFVEGNTAIVTGSIVNVNKPDTIMCSKIQTDHSYNSDQWLSNVLI